MERTLGAETIELMRGPGAGTSCPENAFDVIVRVSWVVNGTEVTLRRSERIEGDTAKVAAAAAQMLKEMREKVFRAG